MTIISRYPFKEVEFNAFTDHGDAAKMFVDGEWFARKGAGRIQIEPIPNITVHYYNILKASQNLFEFIY